MKVRPLHDRVVLKRLAEEEKTKGGLIIPDTAKEKPVEAKIIAEHLEKARTRRTSSPGA